MDLGKKIFKKRFVMPAYIDKPLRYLKYVVLVVMVVMAFVTAGLWVAPYDPWSDYGHLSEGFSSIWAESPIGLIILGLVLIGSLLYDRFFCKYICPTGAMIGIIGNLSPMKIERNEDLCIKCGKCNQACSMNIEIMKSKEVKTAECISCNKCVLDCPKKGALEIKHGKKTLKPAVVMALVLTLFFGTILTTKALGAFNVLPQPIAAGTTIKLSEVKGYMTIEDGAKATGHSVEEFYKLFKIPENVPSNTIMKNISTVAPEFSLDEIKDKLKKEGK